MSRPTKFTPEVIAQARLAAGESAEIAQLRASLAVVLTAVHGLSMTETAGALGISRTQLYVLQQRARGLLPPPAGGHGGRRRETMSLAEEKAFLEPWATEAVTAGMVIVPPLHAALEKQLGHRLQASIVYRMLERHGWRKVAPDSIHPKADPAKQEDWKKNSRKWWPKSSPALMPPAKDRV